jgi:UDP:flavonoid glycosyltransferase YjiC (YdhE family)
VRILFSFVGGLGHLEPLVPLARAAAAAGHAVAFTAAPGMVAATETRGFAAFPATAPPATPPGSSRPSRRACAPYRRPRTAWRCG